MRDGILRIVSGTMGMGKLKSEPWGNSRYFDSLLDSLCSREIIYGLIDGRSNRLILVHVSNNATDTMSRSRPMRVKKSLELANWTPTIKAEIKRSMTATFGAHQRD